MAEAPAPVLVAGRWVEEGPRSVARSSDPATGETVGTFPVSPWATVNGALDAGMAAFRQMEASGPDAWARFLESLADLIEARAETLVEAAVQETGLPAAPRLGDVELPRTTDQLRQAAAAARSRVWRRPELSPAAGISAYRAPIPGVVVVLGPNNFPFAFNGVGGGDFAAAVATGHPVLAKANPGHPHTTRLLAETAVDAAEAAGMAPGVVQLIYAVEPEDGLRLVGDRRVAATAFTGSQRAGLALKRAADTAGRPAFFEMGSLNPVVLLPAAVAERGAEIAGEIAGSALLGNGQFCTKPGLVFVAADQADPITGALANAFAADGGGTLLGEGVRKGLVEGIEVLVKAGAAVVQTGELGGGRSRHPATLLAVDGGHFLAAADALQTEVFGNAALLVRWGDVDELLACIDRLEGQLTGTIYASASDEAVYAAVAPRLRERVGRLLDNKPPTGVAVVPAMHHGGPYPATGHPGFTSVGIPASLDRFTMRQSYDNVADHHLPPELRAANPLGITRLVDGEWTSRPSGAE